MCDQAGAGGSGSREEVDEEPMNVDKMDVRIIISIHDYFIFKMKKVMKLMDESGSDDT